MSDELNCSEGARMLIERMQSHPQDFKHGGRFRWVFEKTMGLTPKGHYEISDRDDDALTAAMEKYILEPWLTETVVDEIFNGDRLRQEQKEQEQQDLNARYSKALATSMANTKNAVSSGVITGGWSDPRLAMQNSTTAIQPGMLTHVQSQGREWFEEERKRLREATERTLKKLKRDKSK